MSYNGNFNTGQDDEFDGGREEHEYAKRKWAERSMKTIEQQIASVKRELALRKNVYPKWVASGRMQQDSADHEIECMQEVLNTLEGCKLFVSKMENLL